MVSSSFLLLIIAVGSTLAHAPERQLVYDNVNQTPCPDSGCFGKPWGTYWIPDFWKEHPIIHWRCASPGMLALTFDDGPNGANTALILDELRDLGNVRATFFVNGIYLRDTPSLGALITRAERENHCVASHTVTHADMDGKSDSEIDDFIADEVTENERLVNQYLAIRGTMKKYLRPPRLRMDQKMADKLQSLGYEIVQISIDTDDWKDRSTSAMTEAFTTNMADTPETVAENSYIGLQHDNQVRTIPVIRPVVEWAQGFGYQLVTMEECLSGTSIPGPCSASACTNLNDCRGKDGTCDAQHCGSDDTTWSLACMDDVGCSGDPCEDTNECRSQWGYCGSTSGYCNSASIWSKKCLDGSGGDTDRPTEQPTSKPTAKPTPKPTDKPTLEPSASPTTSPQAGDNAPTRSPEEAGDSDNDADDQGGDQDGQNQGDVPSDPIITNTASALTPTAGVAASITTLILYQFRFH